MHELALRSSMNLLASSNMFGRILVLALCLLAAGATLSACVMADQSGRALPDEVYQSSGEELGTLSFHFRTTLNYLSVAARLALLAGLLLLVRRSWKNPDRQALILAFLTVTSLASGYLLVSGASKVLRYEIAVDEEGLRIRIPFQTDLRAPWNQVYGVRVAGKEWREGFASLYTEWSEMQVLLSGGRRIKVDLEELGVVQRSIFMKALQQRSKMQSLQRGPGLGL